MKAGETAVVLIEFQNEFCKPGGKLHDVVKSEIDRQGTIVNAVALAEKARAKGCLIVHCPFVFDEAWVEKQAVCGIIGEAVGAFQPGDWGTALIDELAPAPGEPILSGKRALSGFTNTELEQIFQEKGIRNVAIAGFLSNVCVESTARSAYDQGYQVRVIHNATAATSHANQQYVEREVYPLLGGSLTADEFIAALA